MLKVACGAFLALVVLVAAAASGTFFRFWPVSLGDRTLHIDGNTISQLQKLRSERKFLEYEPSLYPGAPSDTVRLAAQDAVDSAIDELVVALPTRPRRSTVLSAIKRSLPAFDVMDSEEQDRAVLYFEQVMSITGVRSSGELLNVWRYGLPMGWFGGA